jgi:preprotein translocase subunit YajC
MFAYSFIIAQASQGESHPLIGMLPMVVIFVIFYFVLILPQRNKQKKIEAMVAALKPGDRIIVNPGIFGTVVALEGHAVQVRIDDKTKIKVLRSAVAGLQDETEETEKK